MNDRYFRTGRHRGYMWCVRRTEAGTVCCYVNVSQNAALRDMWFRSEDWSEIEDVMPMHGGVTYFSKGAPCGGGRIWEDDIVVGCDYGHCGDTLMSFRDPVSLMVSTVSEADAEAGTKAAIDALLLRADA